MNNVLKGKQYLGKLTNEILFIIFLTSPAFSIQLFSSDQLFTNDNFKINNAAFVLSKKTYDVMLNLKLLHFHKASK